MSLNSIPISTTQILIIGGWDGRNDSKGSYFFNGDTDSFTTRG